MPDRVTKLLWLPAAALLAAAVLLGGCATPPKNDPEALAAYKENNDPLEPMNRYFFEVNYALDELLLKPLASWYNLLLPPPVERGIHNALVNMDAPVVFANDVLQGNSKRAGITFKRFLINTTLGIGGLFDVASKLGLKYHDTDFGVTFAVWGVKEGPYLVLPLLGPSNPRDAVGFGVAQVADPWYYVFKHFDVEFATYIRAGVEILDIRARNLETLDQIRKGAIDYYATMRSLYRQHRNDQIKAGQTDDPLASLPFEAPKGPQLTESN
jgi:phospholipid-binding lipoprotein MlaA